MLLSLRCRSSQAQRAVRPLCAVWPVTVLPVIGEASDDDARIDDDQRESRSARTALTAALKPARPPARPPARSSSSSSRRLPRLVAARHRWRTAGLVPRGRRWRTFERRPNIRLATREASHESHFAAGIDPAIPVGTEQFEPVAGCPLAVASTGAGSFSSPICTPHVGPVRGGVPRRSFPVVRNLDPCRCRGV
jgi:hypothetical protein